MHGVRHGSLACSGFAPAKNSAEVVICDQCGDMLLKLVYAKYEPAKPSYPAMFKVYEELSSCMKNGWKLIPAISKLPVSDNSCIATDHITL